MGVGILLLIVVAGALIERHVHVTPALAPTNADVEVKSSVVQATSSSTISILAFGDAMFDRQVRLFMQKYGSDFPFDQITDVVAGHDIVVINLEGPITAFPSKTIDFSNKTLQFTFPPETAKVLARHHVDIVSLANNHTMNMGREGLESTKKFLGDAGVTYFGDPFNKNDLSFIKEVKGVRIGFVGYHEFYATSTTEVEREISRLKDGTMADFIIVMPHWGVEYNKGATLDQRVKAHTFIDVGADLVLGAHPHVIEPIEVYKNKAIFYSLGNFIFDQSFSYDTTHGLSVEIEIDPHGREVKYRLKPIHIVMSQPRLASPEDTVKILSEISRNSFGDKDKKISIVDGEFRLSY
jgi:gamma-polyglutamate biosynthesis protein CapA